MRLLHTSDFTLRDFFDERIPPYVVLSHTWAEEEILFTDIEQGTFRSKKQWHKVEGTCQKAEQDGYSWVWIDTCCIDKRSSAELSEAINSMYRWYARADTCYVHLADYADGQPVGTKSLRQCRWFSRGWTLQELLAPLNVEFYNASWQELGTKLSLSSILAHITGIAISILSWPDNINSCSVAYRFSWMAGRTTSRSEDKAYALMGLFGISMPLLYGEGGEKAFQRVQEEIMRKFDDNSIFLFYEHRYLSEEQTRFLATSPDEFCRPATCPFRHPMIDYPNLTVSSEVAQKYQLDLLESPMSMTIQTSPLFTTQALQSSKAGHLTVPLWIWSKENDTGKQVPEVRINGEPRDDIYLQPPSPIQYRPRTPDRESLALLNVYVSTSEGIPSRLALKLCPTTKGSHNVFYARMARILLIKEDYEIEMMRTATHLMTHLEIRDAPLAPIVQSRSVSLIVESPMTTHDIFYVRRDKIAIEFVALFTIGKGLPKQGTMYLAIGFVLGSKDHVLNLKGEIHSNPIQQRARQLYEQWSINAPEQPVVDTYPPTDRMRLKHLHWRFSISLRRTPTDRMSNTTSLKLAVVEEERDRPPFRTILQADDPWGEMLHSEDTNEMESSMEGLVIE